MSLEYTYENYIGLQLTNGYLLKEQIGSGKIGFVFKAIKTNSDINIIHACKIIPINNLKYGWEKELEKVIKLTGIDNVVQYHSHGLDYDKKNRPFTWILWNFIDGYNLNEYLTKQPWPLTITFIEEVAFIIMKVLFACRHENIQHGDLHIGNILISKPDIRKFNSRPEVWVSDFGYGGSHNNLSPKDDQKQLFSIVSNLLHRLDFPALDPIDRILYQKYEAFFNKSFLEIDPTQGNYVGNLKLLIESFLEIKKLTQDELRRVAKGDSIKEPGDYLSAETLGFRADEWKHLFVPEFLAAQDLLSKNITVLTGARGCGKTMAFRRLTAYMDNIIGESSGVSGADQFLGFYVNCRDLIEAFPWIPSNISKNVTAQLIHYFHIVWVSEILRTIFYEKLENDYKWLEVFIVKLFDNPKYVFLGTSGILKNVLSILEVEKEKCRSADFNTKSNGVNKWLLSKTDLLDEFHALLKANLPWANQKPFYLFLDDYTIPIIPRNVQRVLNPIIFKRRSDLFFKVSTESAISFERIGLRGKPLELHQDFELIDLATESLYQDSKSKIELVSKIFKPRIERHEVLKNRGLQLKDLLGVTPESGNELAWLIRNASQKVGEKKKITYCGIQSFVGLWSSDIRIMIQMFVDMLRESYSRILDINTSVDPRLQDRVFRAAGGEFLAYTASVPNPSFLEKRQISLEKNTSFGTHLKDIVEAFINVSKFELSFGAVVSNQGRTNPKQAFRLEIIDKFDLDPQVQDFYDGLVRWHIFLQDWRGKSVRGMITPRLFLNRVMIPHSNLTFSSHDNIHISNQELIRLLKEPKGFLEYWTRKRKRAQGNGNQAHLDLQ